MENQTAFDLNLAIRSWRENLANSPAFQSENLNELESHLRDSIERLCTPQLSAEEAFLIATRRIGKSQQLESEFGKLNRNSIWFDRILWILMAIQLGALISGLSSFLQSVAYPLGVIGGDWLSNSFALMFSPFVLGIAAVLFWRYFIWPKRRGSALLQKLLRQPRNLALSLFLLCVAIHMASAWAAATWFFPAVAPHVSYRVWQMRLVLIRLPTLAFWAGLTYFIARKRLRATVA
jgi:hypothetical protein